MQDLARPIVDLIATTWDTLFNSTCAEYIQYAPACLLGRCTPGTSSSRSLGLPKAVQRLDLANTNPRVKMRSPLSHLWPHRGPECYHLGHPFQQHLNLWGALKLASTRFWEDKKGDSVVQAAGGRHGHADGHLSGRPGHAYADCRPGG